MARRAPSYYPIYLNVAGRKCVVVGGGKVAMRKAKSLLAAGADVVMVSPEIRRGLRPAKGLRAIRRKYRAADIKGAVLAIAATDNEAINRKVCEDAQKRNIPVNIVDQPDLCSFIVPACVRRGRLTISVSTGGASPSLASRIRREIERRYGEEYGDLLAAIGEARAEVISRIRNSGERQKIFEKMSSPAMLKILREKGKKALRAELKRLIRAR